MSTRWQDQPKMGIQYLERQEFHFQFVNWFIPLKILKTPYQPIYKSGQFLGIGCKIPSGAW